MRAVASGLPDVRRPVFTCTRTQLRTVWRVAHDLDVAALVRCDASLHRMIEGSLDGGEAIVKAWLRDYLDDLHALRPEATPSASEARDMLPGWLATMATDADAVCYETRMSRHDSFVSDRRPTLSQLRRAETLFPGRALAVTPVRLTGYFGRPSVGAWMLYDVMRSHELLAIADRGGPRLGARFRVTAAGVAALARAERGADDISTNFRGIECVYVGGGRNGGAVVPYDRSLEPALLAQPLVYPTYVGAQRGDMLWSLREWGRITRPEAVPPLEGRAAVQEELAAWRRGIVTALLDRLRENPGAGRGGSWLAVDVVESPAFRVRQSARWHGSGFVLDIPRRAIPAVRRAAQAAWNPATVPGPLVACGSSGGVGSLVIAVWLSAATDGPALRLGQCRVDDDHHLLLVSADPISPARRGVDASWPSMGLYIAAASSSWPSSRAAGEADPVADLRPAKVGYGTGAPRVAVMESGRLVHSFEERFDEMLRIAREFAAVHGHLFPKKAHRPEGTNLYMWLMNQERRLKAGLLEPERCAALEEMPAWLDRVRVRRVLPLTASDGPVDRGTAATDGIGR